MGAPNFREFVDKFSDIVSLDPSASPPTVELIGTGDRRPPQGSSSSAYTSAHLAARLPLSAPGSSMTTSEQAAIWGEWGRITRFLEGARLAFAREVDLWNSLETDHAARLSNSAGRRTYRIHDHVRAMQDEATLFASVLIHSYALGESAAAEHLSVDSRTFRGIEDWGQRLLQAANRDWNSVAGGLAGAVEAAVARNAFAHGTRRVDAKDEQRLRAAGSTTLASGDPVTLDYATLQRHRSCLRGLLTSGGVGR